LIVVGVRTMIDEYIPSLKKETVTIEKKVYDVLQKNNLDLMEKLNKAKEALKRYAEGNGYIGVSPDGEAFEFEESEYGLDEMKIGWLARETLKEIEQ